MTKAIDRISEAGAFESVEDWHMFLMLAKVGAPHVLVDATELTSGDVSTVDILHASGMFGSKSAIRRLMKQNAFNIFDGNGDSVAKIREERSAQHSEVSDCAVWGTKKDRFMVFVHRA